MRKGELTRQSIVEHAAGLASRIGLGGITIGALAGDLDLSKSGLFAHFRSKEALQLQVLEHAAARFTELVIRPALAAPRGEPRLRALFDRWRRWPEASGLPGGCLFVQAAVELDDQPGPARDQLVQAGAGLARHHRQRGPHRRGRGPLPQGPRRGAAGP